MASPPTTPHTPLRPLHALLGLAALAAIALTLFAWPQARSEPHELPIGVVGTAEATAPIERQLAARGDDFDVTRYTGPAAAREAIEDREIYGAIVVTPTRQAVLTAPAASATVAQLIERVATSAAPQAQLTVVPVVPATEDDPRGAAFNSSILPLILLGVATGALGAFTTTRLRDSLVFLAAASGAIALAVIGVVQGWLGVLDGGWLLNAGAVALTVLAIGTTVAGLLRLIGPPGIGVAALLFVLIGNPWSGVTSAPELLPPAASFIGQLLPPGAGGGLIRETAFFDGAGSAANLVVLLAWTALGLSMLVAGRLLQRKGAKPAPAGPNGRSREPGRKVADLPRHTPVGA
jgi:hypothetical protein